MTQDQQALKETRGLPVLQVQRGLMVRRGRRETPARQELTGNRVLMVLMVLMGRKVTRVLMVLTVLTGRRRMMSLWQMDLLAMRRRGWPALSGQRERQEQQALLARQDHKETLGLLVLRGQRARQEQRERRVIQVLLAQQE